MAGRPMNRLHQEDVRKFYVYAVRDCEEIVYIGKGSGRRWLVQQKRFGLPVDVLEHHKSEKDAYAAEVRLIALHSPAHNKCKGGNGPSCKRKTARKDKWSENVNRIGSRRYAAMLAIAYGANILPKSKVEDLRRVAYG